jgi:hypothetical protein
MCALSRGTCLQSVYATVYLVHHLPGSYSMPDTACFDMA